MNGKITLITPPDIFENESFSILLIYPSDEDQDKLSNYLKDNIGDTHINIYFYANELNIDWLLYAVSKCNYTFVNLDKCDKNTEKIISYILGKQNIFYKTENLNTGMIFNYINQNKITTVEHFLEKALNDKNIK